ncbi:hypothetical protein MNBD_ALPHA03-1510 [hydrothermal vent metagenome]|uniref:TadE-like domain-containing protein n=1 Tax=hydrothermal vent metagenome TaxID=652676 RepID=A0A3B1B002_9ZZZZ
MKKNIRKTPLKKFFKRLRRNQTGSTLVEMAFVLPVISLATIGTLEVGVTMLSVTMLEGAISEASRAGMTGYTANGQTREDYINDLLADRTFGMIDLSNLVIRQRIYEDFADVGIPEPYTDVNGDNAYSAGVDNYTDMNCNDQWDSEVGTDGVGGPGQIVLYEAIYDANFMTGFFSKMMGDDDGKIKLTASTVIQNEPYGTPDPSCIATVKL